MAFESWSSATSNKNFTKAAKAAGLRGETTWRRRAIKEAQPNHTRAKYPPGGGTPAAPRVDGNIKIDVAAAVTAALALS